MASFTITFNTDGMSRPELTRIIREVANEVDNRGDVRPLIRIKDADGKRRGFATADHALIHATDSVLEAIDHARAAAEDDSNDGEIGRWQQVGNAAEAMIETLFGPRPTPAPATEVVPDPWSQG